MESGLAFEIKRQTALIESGGKVVQETRGWDEGKQVTFHQRFKEGSADYRYFPEPDLPFLKLSEIPEFSPARLAESLPELPWQRRSRYHEQFKLKADDVEYLLADTKRSAFFDTVLKELGERSELAMLAANYFISDIGGEPGKMTASAFASLMQLFASNKLSSRGAKDVLALLVERGGGPEGIAKEQGLMQVTDTATLMGFVDVVLTREIAVAEEYRAGKTAALQYLVGQAMKESRGAGNPQAFREMLLERL